MVVAGAADRLFYLLVPRASTCSGICLFSSTGSAAYSYGDLFSYSHTLFYAIVHDFAFVHVQGMYSCIMYYVLGMILNSLG